LAAGDDGGVVAVFEVLEVVLDGGLAGTDVGGDTGVEGAVDAVWSDILGTDSFFSVVAGVGASLSDEGFILSE